jgi:hypothetical protein
VAGDRKGDIAIVNRTMRPSAAHDRFAAEAIVGLA